MSETALQLHKAPEPAVVLTRDDIRKYICPNADDKEIFMFLGICKSFGLNPMKREVHLIKYGNAPASIVTGYEVYLKRAERTGKVNGWRVDIGTDGKSATVTIHRKDWAQPFVWTAYRQEFDKGQANWKTMPLFMLRKVAMAQAFRICFPDEMGGLPYLPEEISGNISESLPAGPTVEAEAVDPAVPPPAAVETPPPASPQPAAQNVGTSQQVPTEKKDDATLRHELQELAGIAEVAGLYETTAAAIQAWSSYVKDGVTKPGYKDVLKMKGWQMARAIGKANDELNAIPPAPVDEGEDDIPM